jgi:hypothetical protein
MIAWKPLRRLALALFVATAACKNAIDVPAGAQLTCSSVADCPTGRICHQGHCADPNLFDTTPPDLVAGSVVVTPSRIRAGQSFSVTIQATEPLVAAPTMTLALSPPIPLACGGAGTTWTCSLTATGAENGGAGGDLALDVRMADRAWNETVRSGIGVVTLDFVPPEPTVATVAYIPGPTNPLPVVQRAAAGTRVRVSVSANEKLSTTATASLVARLGGAQLAFAQLPGVPGDPDVLFEGTVPALEPDGAYTLAVTWTDAVGNQGVALVPGVTVAVKTSAPTLVVDQSGLVFVRSPWGNASDESLGAYSIPAGPYFALEPADTLSTSAALPPTTFSFSDASAPTAVRVHDSTAASALLLGTLFPNPDGSWPRRRLSSPDLSTVYAVGLDDAGNASSAVRIRTAEWVATTNRPVGASPHTLEWTGYASSTLAPQRGNHPVATQEAAGVDAQAVLARTEALWLDRSAGAGPSARSSHAMAYDSARGRAVLFGGTDAINFLDDTWEYDGNSWIKVPTSGPSARQDHAMAYDSARGRVVQFGGTYNSVPLRDTWEFDGRSWIQVATDGPSARNAHAMAYDVGRGRVVLFGGYDGAGRLGDTWEWDGSAWTQVAKTGPSARMYPAMAYDGARGRVVLFGGSATGMLGDTWEWDGSAWTQVASSGPAGRLGPAMAYDAARGRVVLQGGTNKATIFADTWEWNGSAWAQVATGAPGAHAGHAMVFDVGRGRTILFGGGGSAPGALGDTWEWNGSRWVQTATSLPVGRDNSALAYDVARAKVVLFGGDDGATCYGDTWTWDGTGWTSAASTGPSARTNHAMAYDGARSRTVLFGGVSFSSGLLADTWVWDGSVWTSIARAGPSARYGHAMAYDSGRGRTVLFGGSSETVTWEWDGSVWTSVASTGPSPGQGNTMAYDSARSRTVLLGGAWGDTWEWNGSVWSQVAAVGSGPPGASGLAFDSGRGRVVAFVPTMTAAETWEWDGSVWTKIATGAPPTRGPLAYDPARGRVVMAGRGTFPGSPLWVWEYDASRAQQPAIQLGASLLEAGIAPASIDRVRVRAFAGATYQGGPGATLLGWSRGDPTNRVPGEWLPLAVNATAAAGTAPFLPAAPASLVDWRSSSPDDARSFLLERDGLLSFQLRPTGPSSPVPGASRVALDYIEVRIRYTVP